MLLPKTRSRRDDLIEVCHQIPGRLRLRVPALKQAPGLEEAVAAALASIRGVYRVRLNRACVSLVVYHGTELALTREDLKRALRPLLAPSVSGVFPRPDPLHSARWVKPDPERVPKRPRRTLGDSCPICQLKLKAARWILSDVWRCWRDHWAQRLHGRLLASIALFRP